MKNLNFVDADEFYRELIITFNNQQNADVITNYTKFAEVPDRLKRIFHLDEFKNSDWINSKTGEFIPNRTSSLSWATRGLKILDQIGLPLVGTVVGGLSGGILGMAIGTVMGMLTPHQNFTSFTSVQIDKSGRLIIQIRPD